MSIRSSRPVWAAVLALAIAAPVVSAQSLGELAAKEQERREKERQKRGGSSKVITGDDLRGSGKGTLSNAGATTEGETAKEGAEGAKPGESTAPKEKTPDEIRAAKEADWRARSQAAQTEVTQATARVNSLQQALNDVGGNLYSATRTATLNEFETAKRDLAAAQEKVADLEEEGRRNNYR